MDDYLKSRHGGFFFIIAAFWPGRGQASHSDDTNQRLWCIEKRVHFLLRYHGFGSPALLPHLIPYGVDVGRVFIEGQ